MDISSSEAIGSEILAKVVRGFSGETELCFYDPDIDSDDPTKFSLTFYASCTSQDELKDLVNIISTNTQSSFVVKHNNKPKQGVSYSYWECHHSKARPARKRKAADGDGSSNSGPSADMPDPSANIPAANFGSTTPAATTKRRTKKLGCCACIKANRAVDKEVQESRAMPLPSAVTIKWNHNHALVIEDLRHAELSDVVATYSQSPPPASSPTTLQDQKDHIGKVTDELFRHLKAVVCQHMEDVGCETALKDVKRAAAFAKRSRASGKAGIFFRSMHPTGTRTRGAETQTSVSVEQSDNRAGAGNKAINVNTIVVARHTIPPSSSPNSLSSPPPSMHTDGSPMPGAELAMIMKQAGKRPGGGSKAVNVKASVAVRRTLPTSFPPNSLSSPPPSTHTNRSQMRGAEISRITKKAGKRAGGGSKAVNVKSMIVARRRIPTSSSLISVSYPRLNPSKKPTVLSAKRRTIVVHKACLKM